MNRAVGCWLFLLPVLLSGSCVAAVAPPPPARERDAARAVLIEADTARLEALAQVHRASNGSGGEGVLEVLGKQRVSLVAAPSRGCSGILRQLSAGLASSGRSWILLRFVDLPPHQLWKG